MTKQKKLEEQLKHLAYFDGLTNIYNRSYFLDKSSEQLKNAIQTKAPLSFILFDIDYFKKINDHYGHLIGDAAIRHVVSICKKELEHESIFGRYGGEEFVLCLPGKSISDAAKIAEKIRAAIELTPLNTNQELIFVTASFGVSDLNPYAKTLEVLLHESDQALYASKESGRNAVHLAFNGSYVGFDPMVTINK
ncbi:GGDEF domain-containing protein [Neobacillus cucumis]|uniref:GGDEF domain-containing protein n=1 Tax=Neobacillus cucumis TaxID=1740721 RepID=UPI0035F392F6